MINGDKIHWEILENNKKQSLKQTKTSTETQKKQKPKQNTTEFVNAINKTDPAPIVTSI